jgi:hypothetical protein
MLDGCAAAAAAHSWLMLLLLLLLFTPSPVRPGPAQLGRVECPGQADVWQQAGPAGGAWLEPASAGAAAAKVMMSV